MIVTVLATLCPRRKMATTWSGVVERVRDCHRPDPNVDHSTVDMVAVTFRTDQGRRVKVELARNRIDAVYRHGLVAGERVEKTAGACAVPIAHQDRLR